MILRRRMTRSKEPFNVPERTFFTMGDITVFCSVVLVFEKLSNEMPEEDNTERRLPSRGMWPAGLSLSLSLSLSFSFSSSFLVSKLAILPKLLSLLPKRVGRSLKNEDKS